MVVITSILLTHVQNLKREGSNSCTAILYQNIFVAFVPA